MRRFRTAGIVVVLIVASALAGYEVGVHQPVWSSSISQIAKTPPSEQAASDDVTFSVIFDRTVRQAAQKIDGLDVIGVQHSYHQLFLHLANRHSHIMFGQVARQQP